MASSGSACLCRTALAGTVNRVLLEQDAGWCLVDCGTSVAPGWDALEHALGLAGVETRAVELLVCTHAHADHTAWPPR